MSHGFVVVDAVSSCVQQVMGYSQNGHFFPCPPSFAVSLFDRFGIAHDHCTYHLESRLPTSYIVLNTANGSRTIVHYRFACNGVIVLRT